MKKIVFSVLALVIFQTGAFAQEMPCMKQILEKANSMAKDNGMECSFTSDDVKALPADINANGSLDKLCTHHVSQVSVVREFFSLTYSIPTNENGEGLNCAKLTMRQAPAPR